MAAAPVRIGLLSSPSVSVGGAVVDRFPTQRLVALLAYLVLHPIWKAREQIAEAIWPDQPEGKGLASLRNGLSMLRRILEPTDLVLETTRTQARLSAGQIECDVWDLREAITREDHSAVVSIYVGDLLPDLFDEWLEPFREELRSAFHVSAAAEAVRRFRLQEGEKTLALTERWRKSDPFEPEAVQMHALALAATGQRVAAVATLEKFADDYRFEFGELCPFDLPEMIRQVESQKRFSPTVSPSAAPPAAKPALNRGLPVYLSRFFGRESELAEIQAWADSSSSLLTILGTGGIGKTRLAVEATRSPLADSHDVVFIPLAGADSRIAMLAALMQAFNLREAEGEVPEEILRGEFARFSRPTIVVLDNLEQVVSIAATLVIELLPTHGLLKFLCTSREILAIEGEQLLKLAPLNTNSELKASQEEDAVRMFIDRARSTRSDFALSSRNHDDVVALCGELDGLPLAIEIVAAWAGAWSVSQMRANVRDNRIVSRKRGHDPRHQSLEACIAWSFNLLEPEVQQVLCIQSLFRGGWTLEAAKTVSGCESVEAILASLLDRSLISASEIEDEMRFSMFESVRVFCRSRLDQTEAVSAAARFAAYFTEFASVRTDPTAGLRERRNHQKLDRERENFEVVASLCEEGLISVNAAGLMAGQLHLHWTYRGLSRVGIALIERILAVESDEAPGPGHVLALQGLCVMAQDAGEPSKAEWAVGELQALADRQQNPEARFRALTQSGNFLNKHGRFAEGYRHHAMAVTASKALPVPRMGAVAHCNLAESLFGLDRVDEAIHHWKLANDIDHRTGNLAGEAMLYLGFAECLRGNLSSGTDRLQIYLANVYGLGFGRGYARAVYYSALAAARCGNKDLATILADSAKAFLHQTGQVPDALESKCLALIEEQLARTGPSSPETILPIEDAVALTERFLASNALHG